MRVRKGDQVLIGKTLGRVICTGVTMLYVDFGDGFTTLISRHRLEGSKVA